MQSCSSAVAPRVSKRRKCSLGLPGALGVQGLPPCRKESIPVPARHATPLSHVPPQPAPCPSPPTRDSHDVTEAAEVPAQRCTQHHRHHPAAPHARTVQQLLGALAASTPAGAVPAGAHAALSDVRARALLLAAARKRMLVIWASMRFRWSVVTLAAGPEDLSEGSAPVTHPRVRSRCSRRSLR